MRNKRGQMALALNLVIAIFVVGSLGLVAYEMSRIMLAREQLKHCLEFAALGGSAAMASSSQTGASARALGQSAVLSMMEMNSILGQPLATTTTEVASVASINPSPGQTNIYVEFDDPITKQPAASAQDAGVIRVYGAYAYQLFSGGFGSIGVNVYTVMADATAGLPAMDIVIVYNNDDSMDDQTPVTMVRRYWDPTPPAIAYLIPNPGGGGAEEGPLAGLVCNPPLGSAVNGLQPQNLEAAGDSRIVTCPKEFSEIGPSGKTVPLRGTANTGTGPGDSPPSWGNGGIGLAAMWAGVGYVKPSTVAHNFVPNYLGSLFADLADCHWEQPAEADFLPGPDWGSNGYNPWQADATMFTDLVVNLDGNNHFGGITPTGNFSPYPFPSLDFVVEASRGNMESWGIAPNVHTDNPIGAAAKMGYQNAYTDLAYAQLQPKSTMESAINTFTTKLMQTADCHLGFVGFNDRAGQSAMDNITQPAVSYAYPVAGNAYVLLPQISLNPGNNNYAAVTALLTPPNNPMMTNGPMFTPSGGSNLASGIQAANAMLQGAGSRPGAFKAIVVVTDKVPSRDLAGNPFSIPTSNGTAFSDSITQATTANTQGFPIFMVTMAQNATEANAMQTQFSDTSAGVVSTAGNGGTLSVDMWTNPAASYTTLVGRFNNVVRQMLTLVSG